MPARKLENRKNNSAKINKLGFDRFYSGNIRQK